MTGAVRVDLGHAVAPALQHPLEEVLEEERPEVPDVHVAVDRRAAGVEPDLGRRQRLESLLLA